MQSIDVKQAPLGVPVFLEDEAANQVKRHLYCTVAPRYAVIQDAHTYNYHSPKGETDYVNLKVLLGRTMIPRDLFVPSDTFKVKPLGEAAAKKFKAIEDRMERRVIGQKALYEPYLGSDPEVFLQDKKTGNLLPAFDVLPRKGNGKAGFRIPRDSTFSGYSSGFATEIFWDGFQGEFSIGAQTCIGWLTDGIYCGLKEMRDMARAKNENADFLAESVIVVEPEILQTGKDEHIALGCSSSKNVYQTPAISVANPRELPFRFAGGHLHFGDGDKIKSQLEDCVRVLDATVGVASVLWFKGLENPIRRKFYGRAGEYRLPKHGLEYRTLGNAWMYHPAWTHLIFMFSRRSIGLVKRNLLQYWSWDPNEAKEIIDNYDFDGAKKFVDRHRSIFKALLSAEPGASGKAAMLGLEQGLAEFAKDPRDISKNWLLDGGGYHSNGGWGMHSNSGQNNTYWRTAAKTILSGGKI